MPDGTKRSSNHEEAHHRQRHRLGLGAPLRQCRIDKLQLSLLPSLIRPTDNFKKRTCV
jgi:hypothetical protein